MLTPNRRVLLLEEAFASRNAGTEHRYPATYELSRTTGGRTAVPGAGAPLKVVTTGVSFDSPPVTSVRPLSVVPMLMARREMRLPVTVYTKLPTLSEPTAVAGTVSASGRRFISSETSAYMPG